jgi:hypothetical protein
MKSLHSYRCRAAAACARHARLVLFCGLPGLAPLATAAPIAWELNTNTTIDVVNVATNASGPFGTTPFLSDSLAISPAAKLYSADGSGNLWDVTGPPIPVGPTGRTQIGDLDYASNGLWGYSNASQELFFFDFGSLGVTYSQVIALPPNAVVTGVAYQPSSGDIFLSANNGLNSDALLRVPAFATSATLVGGMTIGDAFSYISDIDFDAAGNLIAMTFFHRYFYTVSPTTAATTFISAGPHRDTTGLALSPVPEPGSWEMLLAGAMLVGWRVRREG